MMEIVGAPIELKREFKNVDDFKLYYETHRDEFKNKKSNRLNKEYRIVGYKISNAKLDASNGEIKLVKVYAKSKNNIDECINTCNTCLTRIKADISAQSQRLDELEHKIKILTDSLAQIIDLVNSNANSS